jgi:hypothetical protein
MNCTGFAGTIAGNAAGIIGVKGDFTASSTMTWSNAGGISFIKSGTCLFTGAGITLGPITVNGNSSTVLSLQSALISSAAVTVTNGTFTTNGYAITATGLSSSNSNVRTINLGSSTVAINGGGGIDFTTSTNLTVNAGTSSISLSSAGVTLSGGNQTFYNVSFTNTTVSNLEFIQGANTFNNLTFTGPATAGLSTIYFYAGQTINGTLSTTGTAGNRRVVLRSDTVGIARTLTINGTPSLTDADFQDLYVIGNASPISGTRLGNRGGTNGITFSSPKNVYWVTLAGGNWSGNNWAATSGGTANTDNFPLAQDTAVVENTGLNTSATVTLDSLLSSAISSINMSTRTNAMTLSISSANTIYGNWTSGSGTTIGGGSILTFAGRNTQTITSAGKAFGSSITIDSYGGTVQLADALNIGGNFITVTNGTFDTKSYSLTLAQLSSNNSNVRTIILGSSTISASYSGSPVDVGTNTNLTFNAGTSTISTTSSISSFSGSGLTYYNLTIGVPNSGTTSITGANTFNNLTLPVSSFTGLNNFTFNANQTINGTLTVAGATAIRRMFLRSDTIGTARTLTVNSLSATDCDFRDITIAGAAAGSSPTRAGDCGGNTGITFSSKTVYWNLAGTQDWTATGWCPSSGGTPNINQFPLAQDTAIFDNTGAAGTVNLNAFNIGSINASARTSAMSLTITTGNTLSYGDLTLGTGVSTLSSAFGLYFSKNGTQTITSNGVQFIFGTLANRGIIELADAFSSLATFGFGGLNSTIDAKTYNVTCASFTNASSANTLKMGSGTWTLTGTGTVWTANGATIYCGTANIVLSDNTTTARTFSGGNKVYNKITIGGATSTSTTTFNNSDTFSELASTKTVAHTINLPSGITPTYGAWTVTGTAGNIVTVTGTATVTIAGARVSGVDYLALGTTTISATSPGEFYAGANSTGGTNAILTAAPAPVTRYWVGGSGTWDATTTTNWSATSGGSGGASVPTSADTVIFDSLSNATAYAVTCTATQLRCGAITFSAPLTGNVTWAGTAPLAIHGNFTLPATGLARSYTGTLTFSGSSTGKTITTNGVAFSSNITFNGIGCGWSLGSALSTFLTFSVDRGSFDTAGYALSTTGASSFITNNYDDVRTISFGASTVTFNGYAFRNTNLTFNKGTSTVVSSTTASNFIIYNTSASDLGSLEFYNITLSSTSSGRALTINGSITANTVTVAAVTGTSVGTLSFNGNQTYNTLTLQTPAGATSRTSLISSVVGTTRTLTLGAFTATSDYDFRDIAVTGAAAPISGTRFGDLKGNSGITFGAGVTRYWNLIGGGNWSSTGWAATSGGSPAVNNFPLAQDTALFEATGLTSGNTVTIDAAWNIGTIDMSARTSNTMTLAVTSCRIYGNWINGTGTTLSNSLALTFAGRGSQTITSAGKTFPQPIIIDSLGGSLSLQDAFTSNYSLNAISLTNGTFNLNGYSVSLTSSSGYFLSTNPSVRTVAFGSNSTFTIAGNQGWSTGSSGLSITGTGQISLTCASAKPFAGSGISYSGITINQGGAGTLTFNDSNTFKDITNTYSATGASTINLASTTQTVSQFTGTGAASKLLTLQGTSAGSPGTLVLTGATNPSVDYLNVTNVRAYPINSWSAGYNSVNNGSLGFLFPILVISVTLETGSGADTVSATLLFSASIAEAASGVESIASGFGYNGLIAEAASGLDSLSNIGTFNLTILEVASGLEEVFPTGSFNISVSESASGDESQTGLNQILSIITEAASGLESSSNIGTFSIEVEELASGSSTATSSGTFNISVVESSSGEDSFISFAITDNSVSESASGLDDQSSNITFNLSVSETASGIESLISQAFLVALIEETASALENLGVGGTFNIAITEAASGLDQESNTGIFNIAITEASTGSAVLIGKLLWEPIDDQQTPNWITIDTTPSAGFT